MAMKMRQSLAELEQEFRHEMQVDRRRQDDRLRAARDLALTQAEA